PSCVSADQITPGRVARGRLIAELDSPLIHDNFEGVAVTQEGGATILWLVSDDNQLFLQKSYLLKFRLDRAAIR
ncbi:esterase-like activity of phytase family protein, partial [Rhizobium brockwellii]|uniref:esterase-like activity of phytase family protein n=1 Tax=Rhizobium brockwellii TaxID=3019932 RepID=UPI003F95F044